MNAGRENGREPQEATVAVATIQEYLKLVPALRQSPQGYLWSSYDREADVLYINFKKPSRLGVGV